MTGACEVCKSQTPETLREVEGHNICTWCGARVRQFLNASKNDIAINIFWGAGKIGVNEAKTLIRLIIDEKVKSVIEYGTGLSTEIISLVVDDLVSLDEYKKHQDMYRTLMGMNKVTFIHYESVGPREQRKELPDLGRKFDMAFVDGGQTREREVRHALKHAERIIYLHDPNMGEESFFPNDDWKADKSERIYRKK